MIHNIKVRLTGPIQVAKARLVNDQAVHEFLGLACNSLLELAKLGNKLSSNSDESLVHK